MYLSFQTTFLISDKPFPHIQTRKTHDLPHLHR